VSTLTQRRVRRLDGEAKVRGSLVFGFDYAEPHMLHGKLLRSPLPAARIVRVDTSAARLLPGVHAVLTCDDIPTTVAGPIVKDQPILAVGEVRYAGEPIAAVAAETRAQAAAAANAIVLELEPLERVDLEHALAPNARPVHDNSRRHEGAFESEADSPPNLVWQTVLECGDVAEAFARAHLVVENTFQAPRQYQAPIEPHCVVARFEHGRFVIHTPTQAPFLVRERVAELLGLRLSDVRIVVPGIGGGFGGKIEPLLEPICALLAQASERPVRLANTRREELQTAGPRENAVIRLRTAVDGDGTLLGLEADCLLDAGAYAGETPLFASAAPLILTATYRIPNARLVARAAYTNTTPTASFRGVCGTYCCFALEGQLDRIARELDLDRRDLRLRNLLRAGDRTAFGQLLEDACLAEAFECVDKLAPWENRPHPRGENRLRRGVGIAAQTWITNPEPGHVSIKLNEDGTVQIVTGAVEIGTGAVAIGAPLLVAEELGVHPGEVSVATPDTDVAAYDGGAQGSRTTFALGNAIRIAAASVRAQILETASELLEVDPADLELIDGTVSGPGVRRLSLADVARAALWTNGPIVGTGAHAVPPTAFDPGTLSGAIVTSLATPTYHVHLAEVEVDTETGKITILRYVVSQDVGRVIDHAAIEGQVQGGVAQGLGYALFEELRLVDGIVAETSLEHYRLPTALDVPTVELTLLESPSTHGPGGIKGVAEPPIVPVAAAVANAISDAIGRPMQRLPITPFAVLEALRKQAPTS
jgi:CO/xanthine dehydrogenase Mo-binding subunit